MKHPDADQVLVILAVMLWMAIAAVVVRSCDREPTPSPTPTPIPRSYSVSEKGQQKWVLYVFVVAVVIAAVVGGLFRLGVIK